ncbi:MAG: hypothetical protein WEB06_03140 [Actinomycetota bacterium]
MIRTIKPYPVYKDSGSPWLGRVPEHWEIWPVRRLFRAVTRHDVDGTEPKMSMSRHHGLIRSAALGKAGSTAQSVAFSVAHPGDLVMNKYQAHAGLFACAVERGLITANYSVFAPTASANTAFYASLFASEPYKAAFLAESYGVGDGMMPLYTKAFYRVPSVVPSPSEQLNIVRFLNHLRHRIESYIRGKRQLIALLNERKQAIVYRAITRGLSGSKHLRPMLSTPVFGISAEWDTARLWTLARIRSERNASGLDLLSVFLGRGVIRYGEGGGQVHKPSLDLSNYQVVHAGDLVLNNQQAWRGSVGVSAYHGIVSPAYVVLALSSGLDRRYADYLFKSRVMVAQFVTSSKGVGDIQRDIHTPWLKNVRVPLPPLPEQTAIASHLDRAFEKLDRQLSFCEREIELLREYRDRLIADVVTGKLDVRQAAKELPEALDQPNHALEDDEDENLGELEEGLEEVSA